MKKSLVLALIMVSVTAMADNTITLDCSSKEAKGFSGRVTLTTQADEVVFADSFLSANGELLTLENMHGTQQNIELGKSTSQYLNIFKLSSDEESLSKQARLVINLGVEGDNASLTVDQKDTYTSICSVVDMSYNPYEDLIQKLSK